MRMSELLNEVRRFSLDEGFSPREIKMAIGIASDPRYAKGNMTGAVTAIEKMKKGLSDHPQVVAVLKRQNEDLDEASKEGTIKIIKTKDGKFQIQKMTKGKFVDIGKPHNSAKEAEKFRSGQPDLFPTNTSATQGKRMGEEVELGEKYDLYHKDFSDAMQHAYSYAKSKMGITVDPKEIDSKVATGPKKPTEGKTNKYMLKGKGGNLQIQVYNKGGSKPFELNMYKEENALIPESNDLISQAAQHISHMQMSEKVDSADVDDDASQKDVDDAAKNIIMQLRKSVSMRGDKEVEFAAIGHGYKKKVDMKIAQKALDMYNKMKPQDKTKFQTTIAKSYKDLLNAIKGK